MNINSLSVSSDTLSLNTIVPGQVKSDTLETGNIKCTSFELNGDSQGEPFIVNSLAIFESIRIESELTCLGYDTILEMEQAQ